MINSHLKSLNELYDQEEYIRLQEKESNNEIIRRLRHECDQLDQEIEKLTFIARSHDTVERKRIGHIDTKFHISSIVHDKPRKREPEEYMASDSTFRYSMLS
jgi:hypothetical protein